MVAPLWSNTDVTPNTLCHADTTLMDEAGADARTNRRFHGHRETDVQGAHYIRCYDMQLLAAAEAIAGRYEAAAGFAMGTVLGWDVDALPPE